MDEDRDTGTAVLALGGSVTLLGVVGYLAGLLSPYPGRAFSITALMVGITMLAVGSGMAARGAP